MTRPDTAGPAKRFLVDQREYYVYVRGGETHLVRWDRQKLWFRVDGLGEVFTVDDVFRVREVPATNGGRQERNWVPISRWYLAPRMRKVPSALPNGRMREWENHPAMRRAQLVGGGYDGE